MKETENLNVVGPAELVVSEDGLRLQSSPPGKTIHMTFVTLNSGREGNENL